MSTLLTLVSLKSFIINVAGVRKDYEKMEIGWDNSIPGAQKKKSSKRNVSRKAFHAYNLYQGLLLAQVGLNIGGK